MRSGWRLACVAGLAGVALAPAAAEAQFVEPPQPVAYALQNVSIVQADGSRTDSVTIVVRDGLIESLGSDIPVPADAQVLEGDGLVVYPGFVDAQGAADYEFPESSIDRDEVLSWAPPREIQSFMPHRRVVDHLTATGETTAQERKKGVIAAGVHAEGRLMPGRGTALLFRKDAAHPTDLVIAPSIGVSASLQGARGVYPTQLFSVMAFYRQSFEDARREGLIEEAYRDDPRGMPTPSWDPDYTVLREALDGAVTMYFAVDVAENIRNVLKLSSEYGFRPVVVGGRDAWRVADLLRDRNVPVLASVAFPKPERWDPDEEPMDAAEVREQERFEKMYGNAARLEQAGVTFALTSGGGEGDLRDGARKAIEYGLSEEAALRALTATPAGLLGAPQLVTVAQGMPATFLVTDGALFGEDTRIVYTLVEGLVERGRVAGAASSGDAAVTVAGSWEYEVEFGDFVFRGRLQLVQDGAEFSGSMTSDQGTQTIRSGTITGSQMSFDVTVEFSGQSFDITYSGTVEGDQISGTMSMEMGSGSWQATRTGEPGEGVGR